VHQRHPMGNRKGTVSQGTGHQYESICKRIYK